MRQKINTIGNDGDINLFSILQLLSRLNKKYVSDEELTIGRRLGSKNINFESNYDNTSTLKNEIACGEVYEKFPDLMFEVLNNIVLLEECKKARNIFSRKKL